MEILRDSDPFFVFRNWLEQARAEDSYNFNAMSLGTSSIDGQPAVRMVLLKEVDDRGFIFYTNMESRKGQELAKNARAALCFYWKPLKKQVRVTGEVEVLSVPLVNAYFKTRHYLSRLGAWASAQSRPLSDPKILEERVREYEAQYGQENIPCPPYWGGYRVVPREIEFWIEGKNRLHDRFLFTRENEAAAWEMVRLNP